MDETNILPAIPGAYVADAGKLLTDPALATEDEGRSVLEVPGHGAVAFTFRRMTHRHGKSSITFWVATKAVRITGGTA